jgi:hypothetical protein
MPDDAVVAALVEHQLVLHRSQPAVTQHQLQAVLQHQLATQHQSLHQLQFRAVAVAVLLLLHQS